MVENVAGPPWIDPVDRMDVLKEPNTTDVFGKVKEAPVLSRFVFKELNVTGVFKRRGPFVNKEPVLTESKFTTDP